MQDPALNPVPEEEADFIPAGGDASQDPADEPEEDLVDDQSVSIDNAPDPEEAADASEEPEPQDEDIGLTNEQLANMAADAPPAEDEVPTAAEIATEAQDKFISWLESENIPVPPGGRYEDVQPYEGGDFLYATVTRHGMFGEQSSEYELKLNEFVRDWVARGASNRPAETPQELEDADDLPPASARVQRIREQNQ
jgi:hypothetical protein